MHRRLAALLVAGAALACHRASEGVSPPPRPAAEAPRPDALAAQGDAAFLRRGEPGQLEAALAAFRRAVAARPGDPALELRLARAEAFRALGADAPAEAAEAFDESARAGERALRALSPAWAMAVDAGEDPIGAAARVDAPGAEALYHVARGTMGAAQARGYAAVLAVKDAALAMMARAAELDERLDAGGPHRALGAWRAGLPVAAGGGAAAARAHFERARALFPDEPLARLAEAETLAVLLQDAARFDDLLAEIAAADPGRDPERAPELALARRRAGELARRKAVLF